MGAAQRELGPQRVRLTHPLTTVWELKPKEVAAAAARFTQARGERKTHWLCPPPTLQSLPVPLLPSPEATHKPSGKGVWEMYFPAVQGRAGKGQ